MNGEISVLLVDDEPSVANLAAVQLERFHDGITVEVETAVADALARFERDPERIDCIVSDYTMPGRDGLDFLAAARESRSKVPFILFTGKGSEEIAGEAISAGVTDYLRKGTGTEQYALLANRIENAVEGHRAERALAASERKYRSLLDAAPDAVFVANDTGDIVETNAAAEELLGRPREEIVGLHQSNLHPAMERERYRNLFEHGLATGRPSAARFDDGSDVLVERADGENVPVEISAGMVEMDERTLVHGRFREVIEQRERERELREERAVTESLFEAMPDPAYAFDTEGRMRRWNDEFASVVEYTEEEIAGMHCFEFLPAEDHDRIRERFDDLVETGESVTVESALVTKSGASIPYEFSGARLVDGGVRGIIGVGRDVTERREREAAVAALHEATRDLVAAENRTSVASAAAAAVEEILGFPIAVVRLHDPETDSLEPVAVTDATTRLLGERPTYARDEGLPWRAFRSGEPVVVGDSVDDVSVRHRLYVPIGDHGTVTVASLDDAFSDTDIRLTRLLAANAAAALGRVGREEQLRRYERMLDAASDSICALDDEGRFTAVNDTYVETMGYTREELLGEHISLLLDDEDLERGRSAIRDLLSAETTASGSFEMAIHTAEDGTAPGEVRTALLTADDEFEGTVAVVRDITERKRHEELLESLHDATREMMDAKTRTDVAEVAVDTAERVLDLPMNGVWLYDEAENALRPTATSEKGSELFETIPTYTATGDSLAWEAFERGETRVYDRVDREANAYNPETPVRSELLVPLGEYGLLTVGSTESEAFDERDISLAKLLAANTEAALNRAEREHQLSVEHDRLMALFENVPDAALSYELVDGKPITRRVNSRFESVFGYPAEEVIDENIDEYIIPSERKAEAESFNEALLQGESLQTTVRRQTVDGVRDFLLHVVPLERGERNVGGYSIYTDITDQKRRERDLERQNELLDGFASVISHDLRNPMSVVQGRLELAHDEHPSTHHEHAIDALSRMDALIEDVLTLARQGKVIGDTERVSLSAVAEQAWRTAGTETASLAIDELGKIEADPDRLTRLFENLFRNATEHAGEESEIVVGPLEDGFFVADDGPGIPADEHDKVFEHGYSTAESGTGLGLMIVRSIADAHGWDVRVTASAAGGARFEVSA